MSKLNIHCLTIATRPVLKCAAEDFRQQLEQAFPGLETELHLLGQDQVTPTGIAIAFLFDNDFASDESAMKAAVQLRQQYEHETFMPISLSDGLTVPPPQLDKLKAYYWPEDNELILATIGAELGLSLRTGKQRLFISYRTADGKLAAEAIYSYLKVKRFNVWLDSARDAYDIETLSLGTDVQKKIEKTISESDAVVLIDTPLAKHSKWVQIEVEHALGMAIPIIPVVLHDSSVKTSYCRFRSLQELHRRVCVLVDQKQDACLVISNTDLEEITEGIVDLLKIAFRCRVLEPKRLRKVFELNQWSFQSNAIIKQIHDASLRRSGQVHSVATYCSHEEPVFSATVRAYVEWLSQIAQTNRHYFRHLYLYPGDVMNDKDIEQLSKEELNVSNANIGFLHYEEAVAMVNRMTGGIHAIYG